MDVGTISLSNAPVVAAKGDLIPKDGLEIMNVEKLNTPKEANSLWRGGVEEIVMVWGKS